MVGQHEDRLARRLGAPPALPDPTPPSPTRPARDRRAARSGRARRGRMPPAAIRPRRGRGSSRATLLEGARRRRSSRDSFVGSVEDHSARRRRRRARSGAVTRSKSALRDARRRSRRCAGTSAAFCAREGPARASTRRWACAAKSSSTNHSCARRSSGPITSLAYTKHPAGVEGARVSPSSPGAPVTHPPPDRAAVRLPFAAIVLAMLPAVLDQDDPQGDVAAGASPATRNPPALRRRCPRSTASSIAAAAVDPAWRRTRRQTAGRKRLRARGCCRARAPSFAGSTLFGTATISTCVVHAQPSEDGQADAGRGPLGSPASAA